MEEKDVTGRFNANLIIGDFITQEGLKAPEYLQQMFELVNYDNNLITNIRRSIINNNLKNSDFTELYQVSGSVEKMLDNLLSQKDLKPLLKTQGTEYSVSYNIKYYESGEIKNHEYSASTAYHLRDDLPDLSKNLISGTVIVKVKDQNTSKERIFESYPYKEAEDIERATNVKQDQWFIQAISGRSFTEIKDHQKNIER